MLSDATNLDSEAKLIEKEIDEDAILGEDDGSFVKPDDSLLPNEDLFLSEANLETTTNISTKVPLKQNMNENFMETAKQTLNNPISSLKQLTGPIANLSPEQRKQMRSLKFEDPKLRNRAERFGLSSSKVITKMCSIYIANILFYIIAYVSY